jgi:hypothetical protein
MRPGEKVTCGPGVNGTGDWARTVTAEPVEAITVQRAKQFTKEKAKDFIEAVPQRPGSRHSSDLFEENFEEMMTVYSFASYSSPSKMQTNLFHLPCGHAATDGYSISGQA